MPKILKDTIKKIPSKQSLRIYKKSNSQNYYCSFYVGYSTMKSGKKEKTLRTKNVKEALKKAIETYKLIISKQDETKLVVNFEKDIALPFFKHRIQKYHLKGKYDNNNQGIREQKRFNNYMKNFFTGFNYNNHELLSQAITDLTHNLKEDKKTDNTISKFLFNLERYV